MNIGIFGGSFNPPHNMHKNIALDLIEKGYLDKIIYIPTGNKYNKKDLIDFNHRLNMVKLMTNNNQKLEVSPIGNNNSYQYTYQVLDYYQAKYPKANIYFICGSDNLAQFNTWKNYKYILENYQLLVIKRNNDNLDTILETYNNYPNRIIIANITSNILSSTYLRNNIKNNTTKEHLDINVYNYIITNNLY